jgi:SSS family solute:Na+ symporter
VEVGRASTIILVGLGLAWIPMMKYVSPQLYIYLQSVQAYIAPPIAACFLLGVLMPRLNGIGAMTALITGFAIGALRLGLELGKAHLTPGSVWSWIATINFLHFAALLFVVSTAILVGVSLATAPPAPDRTAGLTREKRAPGTGAERTARWTSPEVLTSVVLALVIGVLWIVFR